MKEEQIAELEELVRKRSALRNETEKLNEVFETGKENIGFELRDLRRQKDYSYLHFLKDDYGFFDEALRKTYKKIKDELNEIQKKIDEF